MSESLDGRGTGPGRNVRVVALGLATAAVLALAVLVNLPRTGGADVLSEAPPELVGLWTTDDPRYAGRALEIGDSLVVFHTGQDEPRTHVIREARVSTVGGRRQVVFHFGVPEGADQLTVTIGEGPGSTLRLVNNAEVAWTRSHAP